MAHDGSGGPRVTRSEMRGGCDTQPFGVNLSDLGGPGDPVPRRQQR